MEEVLAEMERIEKKIVFLEKENDSLNKENELLREKNNISQTRLKYFEIQANENSNSLNQYKQYP